VIKVIPKASITYAVVSCMSRSVLQPIVTTISRILGAEVTLTDVVGTWKTHLTCLGDIISYRCCVC